MVEFLFPEPSPKQSLFLSDEHRYIGYGGARGGGKSWSIRLKACLLALYYDGIRICIVRRSFPELEENHIKPLKTLLNSSDENKSNRIATYNESKKVFKFKNGSEILLKYCETDKDAERFQGIEFDVLFIDEATHQTEERFVKMNSSVRGTNSFPHRTYITCNPGGVGHTWVKRRFVDRRFKETENPDDYSFIQAFVQDNKALMELDPGYVKELEALPPKLRTAWLEGSWDVFEGQFFEEFVDDPNHYLDRRFTHVIESFEIPRDWPIYRSFDWGFNKPYSCAWWTVDYDGRLYRILESYGCTGTPNEGVKWNQNKVFETIAAIEKEHRWLKGKQIFGIADPSIWASNGGISIVEVANKHGVYFTKGDNQRIPGWMQVHYRLSFDEEGLPMMYIFNTCKDFIRTMPELQFSTTNPEDLDTTGEDHIADETRYMCMARPIKPQIKEEKKPFGDDPLDLQKGYRRI